MSNTPEQPFFTQDSSFWEAAFVEPKSGFLDMEGYRMERRCVAEFCELISMRKHGRWKKYLTPRRSSFKVVDLVNSHTQEENSAWRSIPIKAPLKSTELGELDASFPTNKLAYQQ